jgi:DNA-binding NarL/FixJ family response regulator
MSETSHIAIVEAQNLVRHGLERVLSGSPCWQVVTAVRTLTEFSHTEHRPDIVLYGPPPNAEASVTDAVADLTQHCRVLVMSDFTDSTPIVPVIQAGALGVVTKQICERELVTAVQTVAHGGYYISAQLAPRMQSELCRAERPEPRVLARRELETLRWLAAGLTHGQIARRMGLTEATVSTYVKRIRSKLDVGNKADLTRTAIELGLLEHPEAAPAPTPLRPAEPPAPMRPLLSRGA